MLSTVSSRTSAELNVSAVIVIMAIAAFEEAVGLPVSSFVKASIASLAYAGFDPLRAHGGVHLGDPRVRRLHPVDGAAAALAHEGPADRVLRRLRLDHRAAAGSCDEADDHRQDGRFQPVVHLLPHFGTCVP